MEELLRRVITTLFCYGCNLGPTQTARSVKGFSRRQISWLNLKYVTEETLEKAIAQVINTYNKFDLPGYWGSGKSASVDGTKWSMYEQNMLSEYHIRYGGYGGIGYYHVSDKYVALFSHFIPCGVHEAIYIPVSYTHLDVYKRQGHPLATHSVDPSHRVAGRSSTGGAGPFRPRL